ncbi:MAG: PASTA domain-containing protein [Sporocytophaga sp.]|nr:PASTA domain-containing protein [Sporocytophaga sp.]
MKKNMSSKVRNLLMIVLIAIIGFIGVFKFLDLYTLRNERIKVPNLIGIPVDEIPNIEELNFKINDSIYDKKLQRGIIVNQFPGPDSEVKPNRTISITYNRKIPGLITIPNVIDQPAKEGIINITNAGFLIGKIDTIENNFPIVISMSSNGKTLKGGEQLREGSIINFQVGKEE